MTWTEVDSKNLKKLFNISNMIYNLYGKLYNFDIDLKYEEAEKHIEYLKMGFEMEAEIFEKWDINFEKARILLDLTHIDNENLDFNDLRNMILSRIHERIKQYYYNKLYFDLLREKKDIEEKQAISSVVYCYNINAEYEYLSLHYLDEEKEKIKNQELNEDFASFKYMMLYNHTVFQNYFVANKGNNSSELLFTTPLLADMLKINQTSYDQAEEMFVSLAENILEYLDYYDDASFSDKESLFKIIALKCQFRAAIYYLNDEIIGVFDELLEQLKSSTIKFMLKDVIKNTKKDHCKHYALSLRPDCKP